MMEQDSRKKILEIAKVMFAEKGYDGVSIRQITNTAGVNSSLISYYFNGKEGLYRSVIEEQIHLIKKFKEMVDTEQIDPVKVIRGYVQTMKEIHESSPELERIIYRELSNTSDFFLTSIRENVKPVFLVLYQALDRGIKQGIFRENINKKQAVLMLVGAVNFYFLAKPIHSKLIEQEKDFTQNYLEQLIEVFLQGIAGGKEK